MARKCFRCGVKDAMTSRSWCRDCRYEYDIARWYGLTKEDYGALLERQGGRCALCSEPFGSKVPHVDHDYGCTHPDKGSQCCYRCVRGLLCGPCNHFVGWLEKRFHLLAPALRYLGMEIEP